MVILVVEDNEREANSIADLLNAFGYRVVPSVGLKEGVKRVQEGGWKAVVTDKNLGVHHGVRPLLRELETKHPDIPVILYSGEARTPPEREDLYFWDFVSKAEHPQVLIDTVGRYVPQNRV